MFSDRHSDKLGEWKRCGAQALLRFTCVLGLVIVKYIFRKWKIPKVELIWDERHVLAQWGCEKLYARENVASA